MDRSLNLASALALALACATASAGAQEAPPAADGPGVQVFQRSRAGLEFASAPRADDFSATSPALRELARGNLLRAPLGEQGSLTLRLRGGTLALVWAVPLRP